MRPLLVALALLGSLCAASSAEMKEADDTDVMRFVSEAVSATLTRGGEASDVAWLTRMVSMTSTDGANSVLKVWAAAGVPDEPREGESYVAQVSGDPEIKHLNRGEWRARAIVLQTYERGTEQGGTGMRIEAKVIQDAKTGALRLDSLAMRE